MAVGTLVGGTSRLGGKLATIPLKTSEKRVFPSTRTWEFNESKNVRDSTDVDMRVKIKSAFELIFKTKKLIDVNGISDDIFLRRLIGSPVLLAIRGASVSLTMSQSIDFISTASKVAHVLQKADLKFIDLACDDVTPPIV